MTKQMFLDFGFTLGFNFSFFDFVYELTSKARQVQFSKTKPKISSPKVIRSKAKSKISSSN
jgi:hypothetical protein